jgi:hypothetical protein
MNGEVKFRYKPNNGNAILTVSQIIKNSNNHFIQNKGTYIVNNWTFKNYASAKQAAINNFNNGVYDAAIKLKEG